MNSRELLLAGIDLLFALLIVFVIGFFAVRYDEQRGSSAGVVSLERLETSIDGDYQALQFLAIFLENDELELREYQFGQWKVESSKLKWDWRQALDRELANKDLPIVIYDLEASSRLGDVVRQVAATGQPIGIATAPVPQEQR